MKELKIPSVRMSKHVDEIINLGRRVFKSDVDTLNWITTPQKEFDGLKPLKMIEIGEGDKVVKLLEAALGR